MLDHYRALGLTTLSLLPLHFRADEAALQRRGLGVDASDEDQVAVETAQLLLGQVDVVLGMVDPLALRGEELDELGASVCGHGWTSWRLPSCDGPPGARDRRPPRRTVAPLVRIESHAGGR